MLCQDAPHGETEAPNVAHNGPVCLTEHESVCALSTCVRIHERYTSSSVSLQSACALGLCACLDWTRSYGPPL